MNTITKADLVAAVAHKTSQDPAEVKAVINALTNEINCRLIDGNQVIIRGFGRFYPTLTGSGINNLPGQQGAAYAGKRKIKFRPSQVATTIVSEQ